MIFEACVNSAFSALVAQSGGADRVELCENMAEGGCTPSYGTLLEARKNLSIDLFVMIRPRGGDFTYSDLEFNIMKADILRAKKLGANGVVFGLLLADGTIDKIRMKELIELSQPMQVTFHRAFDFTPDPQSALEELITLGVQRVLTSGQAESVIEGASLIRKLMQLAGDRIVVMPGGGIKEYNLKEVTVLTGAKEYHLYLPKTIPGKNNQNTRTIRLSKSEGHPLDYTVIDLEKVRKSREILNSMR